MHKILGFLGALSMFSVFGVVSANEYCAEARRSPLKVGDVIERIYWSDADSGRANGVCFSKANINAPETGAVGLRGGAKSEAERRLGFRAKSDVIDLTKERVSVVSDIFGFDQYDRQVISIEVEGLSLTKRGLEEGIYKSWPFRNGRALSPKPDHCGSAR